MSNHIIALIKPGFSRVAKAFGPASRFNGLLVRKNR